MDKESYAAFEEENETELLRDFVTSKSLNNDFDKFVFEKWQEDEADKTDKAYEMVKDQQVMNDESNPN